MRIGVAGAGRIGTMHAANLSTLPQVSEVLLYDPVPGRAQAAATAPGARAVDDIGTLLRESDGVVIATPTTSHPAMVRECLAARTPTLCEKPIAASLPEMVELVGEIEAAGVAVVVGFQRRFDPAMVELRRRVVSGELGALYQVRATGFDAAPPDFGYLPTSGGIFRDLMIHDLDAVPWLVGEPVVEVYAAGAVLVDPAFAAADDVDNAVVLLRFASGVLATISAGRHDPLGYDHRIEVLGARDSVVVGLDERTPLRALDRQPPTAAYPGFPERFRVAYRNEMDVFTGVVAGGAENPSPARDSLVSLGLAEACEQSRRGGRPVDTTEWRTP